MDHCRRVAISRSAVERPEPGGPLRAIKPPPSRRTFWASGPGSSQASSCPTLCRFTASWPSTDISARGSPCGQPSTSPRSESRGDGGLSATENRGRFLRSGLMAVRSRRGVSSSSSEAFERLAAWVPSTWVACKWHHAVSSPLSSWGQSCRRHVWSRREKPKVWPVCSIEGVPTGGTMFSVVSQRVAQQLGTIKVVDCSRWPVVRIEARQTEATGRCLGFVSGYVVVGTSNAHCEAYRVEQTREFGQASSTSNSLLTMNLGRWILLAFLARLDDAGVSRCYGLAIRDADPQHRRLVSYFRRMGAVPIRDVGSRLRDFGDRLVWGGEGLIMEVNVKRALSRWQRHLRS
mmetsp:Transcript_3536/g.6693  ORF Transcript_3536/g.6693 Transcript_3536/m.6693 type:complete len:347 (+) Transcript_3536:2175-3215(+)